MSRQGEFVHCLSHASAARIWGIDLVVPDDEEHRTVPRNHSHRNWGVRSHRADLQPDERMAVGDDWVTTPLRTVVDLARTLPPAPALAAADSALRQGLITPAELRSAASRARGPGCGGLRWVARHADRRAGSALESLARQLFLTARIGPLVLQARIRPGGHPYDFLVDGAATLIETDGFAYHRDYPRFAQDCADLVAATEDEYQLLRFTWDDITQRGPRVVETVRHVVSRRRKRR